MKLLSSHGSLSGLEHYSPSSPTPLLSAKHLAKRLIRTTAIALASGFVALCQPVQALQVQVQPDNPQLGDTLSVVIQTETVGSPPTVSMGQKTYPTFAAGTNRYRALVPTTPLDKPGKLLLRVAGDGKVNNIAVPLQNRSFPVQRIRLSGKASAPATQFELNRVAQFKKILTPEKFWNGKFYRPNNARVSSVFGIRRYYNGVFAKNYYHRGVDYAGGFGSPVVAPAAGRIALVGRESQGFRVHGNTVGINHGQGVLSIMLHLSKIKVKEGDFVQAGQVIGSIGSTGASTGPHLHWGLYVHGQSVDPVPWRWQGLN